MVEALAPALKQRLFAGGTAEPDLAVLVDETVATHVLLGSLSCVDQGSVMNTAMRSYRVVAELRLLDLAGKPSSLLAQQRAHKVGLGINPTIGCERGLERVLDELLPTITAALRGSPALPPQS